MISRKSFHLSLGHLISLFSAFAAIDACPHGLRGSGNKLYGFPVLTQSFYLSLDKRGFLYRIKYLHIDNYL
nr:MAG TPA: hypothetical protein [Caudoviricetes sp.]